MSHSFAAHADYVAFLAGQCLKLKEGKSVGDAYAASVSLEVANPPPAFPERRGRWRTIKLALPAELNTAFGTQSLAWLSYRSEDFARDYERKGFPPGSPSGHLFDGGSFGFTLDPESRGSQPESGAVPVVPAPDEATIAEYVMRTPSSADHWDALVKVAAILRKHRQPLGDALSDWILCAADRKTRRPDGRKVDRKSRNALRNYAIIEAVRALERCGMMAMTSDREPGPACDAVARAFTLEARTVLNIRKSLKI